MHSSTNAAHLSTTDPDFAEIYDMAVGIAHKTNFKTVRSATEQQREREGERNGRGQNKREPEKDKQGMGTKRERRRGSNGRGASYTRDISLVCFPLLRGRQLSVAGVEYSAAMIREEGSCI